MFGATSARRDRSRSHAPSHWRHRVRGFTRVAAGLSAGLVGLVVAAIAPLTLTASAAQAAGPCDPGSNPIVCENSLPGSPASEWMVDAAYGDINGYGTKSSLQAGETMPFKVRTPAGAWHVEIYRLGWYGGDGARLMASVTPAAALPQSQPECLRDSSSGLVDCGNWAVSASWTLPAGAVSGFYVANFLRDDGTFGANQFPFVVRDDSSTSDLVLQTSDQTWQAYNSYGGNSLYIGSFAGSSDGRAYKVSYNRPYTNTGNQNFQNDELPMIRWVERNGYDVSYLSGVDTSRNPALLLNHQTFISSGHDEYWNGPQRAGVEQARSAGVNLAFFTGNEMFWKTRFEPSIDGTSTDYRTMVCYKETKAGAKIDPSPEWTGTWRDPRLSPPSNGGRPENAVTGTLFRVNGTTRDTMTVPARYGAMRLWRNTDIAQLPPGQTASLTPSSLGHEWDEFADNGFRPPGAVAMSQTTVTFSSGEWVLSDYGNTYGTGTVTHSLVLYRDQTSGALVFGAGTVQWAWGLDQLHLNPGPAVDVRMQQATVNLFADMGAQPQSLQSGVVAATKSTDSVGPAVTISAPAAGASIPLGSSTVVSGTATDTGGQVAGIEVSVDGGGSWHAAQPGADGSYTQWAYDWTPSQQGPGSVQVRGSDDSANIGAVAEVAVTVAGRTCPCTLFAQATPSVVDAGDASAYELGVRFQSSVDSSVTGVRFYKATANTGTHTGSLWTSSGQRLATGTFAAETASGWQQLTFSSPVPITVGTTYIASYTTAGHYSVDTGYFADGGAGLPPLTAPASTPAAPQGVFTGGTGFPTSSFRDSNYWVDVTVDAAATDSQPPQVTSTEPADLAADVPTSVSVTAVFSEAVTAGSVQFTLAGPDGSVVPGTITVAADSRSVSFDPTSELSPQATYTASIRATDNAGNLMPAAHSWSFTTVAPPGPVTCPCSIFGSTVPGVVDSGDGSAVELGVRFEATTGSFVTGVRFYKATANTGTHTGSLWTSTGQRLATGTFTGESSSGWQTLTFAAPVQVAAGVDYIASYNTTAGHYSADRGYFATTGAGAPPVTAPASSASAPNGIYTYGGGFPTGSFQDTNYWVDVVVTSEGVDTVPPAVTSTDPVDQTDDVATDAPVSATFDEPVDPTTVSFGLTPAVDGTTTVSADGRAATFVPTAGLEPGTAYTVSVRASDVAGNAMTQAATWSFTTAAPPGPVTCPCSIFGSSTPSVIDSGDPDAVELGVRLVPSVSGTVTGVRFYKAAANTGTHTGSLWTATGQLLATGTFANETASGWQTLTFASPVTVSGGAQYVVSYRAPSGHYSVDVNYFATGGAGQPPITAPASTSGARNGLYKYGAGFPNQSHRASNYWVDALFTPGSDNTPPAVTGRTPAPSATEVSTSVTVRATFSEPVLPDSVSLSVAGPDGTPASGEVALAADGGSVTFTVYGEFAAGTSYTVTLSAADLYGNAMPSPDVWTFTTSAGPPPVVCPCTVFGNRVPARVDGGDPDAVELGMRFTPSVAATVTGVRFYKSAANTGVHTGSLWSSDGQLLATGTFEAESATGWQTLTLADPVPIQADVNYIVSYLAPNGHYSADRGYFSGSSAGTPPVTAPGSVAGAPNGLYRYGGGFPNGSFRDTNYWVDVVLTTQPNAPNTESCPCSLFAPTDAPVRSTDRSGGAELGMAWTPDTSGTVTAIRFYKAPGDTGTHTGSLWTSAGTLLGTGTFSGETASGWQELELANPVAVTASGLYVVSIWNPQARYGFTNGDFNSARVSGPLTAPATADGGNGRQRFGTASGFPSASAPRGRNFFVDVVFDPAG